MSLDGFYHEHLQETYGFPWFSPWFSPSNKSVFFPVKSCPETNDDKKPGISARTSKLLRRHAVRTTRRRTRTRRKVKLRKQKLMRSVRDRSSWCFWEMKCSIVLLCFLFLLPKYQILIFEGRFIQMTGGKKRGWEMVRTIMNHPKCGYVRGVNRHRPPVDIACWKPPFRHVTWCTRRWSCHPLRRSNLVPSSSRELSSWRRLMRWISLDPW